MLAVCLHVYYEEQLPNILKYLENLNGVDYDLFVTGSNLSQETINQLKSFNSETIFIDTPNRGYDIGPFIEFLHHIDFDKYEYVLKLHTKRRKGGDYGRFNGVLIDTVLWSDMLFDAVLGSKEIVKNNFSLLENDKKIGMLGSRYVLTSEHWTYDALKEPIKREAQKIFLTLDNGIQFVAGTIFLVRTHLLKPFLAYSIDDFEQSYTQIHDFTLSHCLERLFGIAVVAQDFKIEGVANKNYLFRRMFIEFKRFIFQKKTTNNGKLLIKVCKIPLCSLMPAHSLLPIEKAYKLSPWNKKRLAIYAAYNKEGIITKADLHYIRALKEVADNVIYIADTNLAVGEETKLSNDVCYLLAKPHGEYDFGSYKRGFFYAKEQGLLDGVEEIIFCNDSCYAPVCSFEPMFSHMKNCNADFWGITENYEFSRHLQSYFLVIRANVFLSDDFVSFLQNIKKEKCTLDVIKNYEVGLSKLLLNKGFSCASYISPANQDMECNNLTFYPVYLLKHGCPVIKKKAFFQDKSNAEGIFYSWVVACLYSKEMKCVLPSFFRIVLNIFSLSVMKLGRFFFQKKCTHSGKLIIKVCKIPVYSKRLGEI